MDKRYFRGRGLPVVAAILAVVAAGLPYAPQASAATIAPTHLLVGASSQQQQTESSRFFPQTGKTVEGRFLDYWNSHGGVMQQGYPISDEMQEQSETDGRTYTVQYFERAVFELHPENAAPYDVLLSLIGASQYERKYPPGAPSQQPDTSAG